MPMPHKNKLLSVLSDAEQDALIADAAALQRGEALPLDGGTKDGAHGDQGQYRVGA